MSQEMKYMLKGLASDLPQEWQEKAEAIEAQVIDLGEQLVAGAMDSGDSNAKVATVVGISLGIMQYEELIDKIQ